MTQMSAEQAIEQVHRMLRRGDTTGAFRISTQIVRQAPAFAIGLLTHARVLIRVGRGRVARDILERVIPALPDEQKARAQVDLARAWLCDGHAERAVEIAAPLYEANAGDVETAAVHAAALVASGNTAAAVEVLDAAASAELDTIDLAVVRGRCALAGEQSLASAAIASLTEHVSRVGADADHLRDALRTLGELHARAGSDDDAFASFRRAARMRAAQLDPTPHRAAVEKYASGWSRDSLKSAPRLAGEGEQAGAGATFVVGLPGGTGGVVAAIAAAAGVDAVAEPDALVIAALGSLKVEQASYIAFVPRPAALSEPTLRTFRKSLLARIRGDAGDRVLDPSWPNAYLFSVLPLALPEARIVRVDRPLADACTATFLSEDGPQTPFAGDPAVTARVLTDASNMIDHHWSLVSADDTPNPTHRCDYDALASGDQAAISGLLTFLGVDPDADTLERACSAATRYASDAAHAPGVGERFANKLRDMHRVLADG